MTLIQILLGIVLISYAGGNQDSRRYSRQSSSHVHSNPQSNPRGPPPGQPQYQVNGGQPQPQSQSQQQFRPPQRGPPPGQPQPPNGQPQQGQGQPQFGNPNQQSLPPGMRWPSDGQSVGQNVGQLPGQPPLDQPMTMVQPARLDQPSNQEVLDGVYRLSEEIVEAVVERLEEDEAMAIEMERQGFDPDIYSSVSSVKSTWLLFVTCWALHL